MVKFNETSLLSMQSTLGGTTLGKIINSRLVKQTGIFLEGLKFH